MTLGLFHLSCIRKGRFTSTSSCLILDCNSKNQFVSFCQVISRVHHFDQPWQERKKPSLQKLKFWKWQQVWSYFCYGSYGPSIIVDPREWFCLSEIIIKNKGNKELVTFWKKLWYLSTLFNPLPPLTIGIIIEENVYNYERPLIR